MRFRSILVGSLTLVGALVVVMIIVAVMVAIYFSVKVTSRVPSKTIVEVNFERGVAEYAPDESVSGLLGREKASIRETVEAIERASNDTRVVALIGRVGVSAMGMATIQEMRNAVLNFRSKGKPAIAFADTFGEFGPGNGAYYLATAFDQIYMQPSGDVGLTGLIYKAPFVRGTLDKLGVTPRLDHRGKYKTAMNMFTDRAFTDAQKESTQQIMESHFSQITKGVATARGITQDAVMTLVNHGPFSADEAVKSYLLDGLAYRDEVHEKVKEKVGQDAKVLSLLKFRKATGGDNGKGPAIALIYGLGSIHRGESDFSILDGGISMGSETLTSAFHDAANDKSIRAILFRVNSPGGSYVASDTIWREILRVRKKKIPIIVSMGDVAASGGYFISMAADKIVAQPGTLTGSIGVFAGKPLTKDFWEKLGVTWDEVHTSDNANFWTTLEDYSPDQWARFEQWLDRVYTDFTTKVAESRKLPKEKVLQIAQGRVWTGESAKELGLVDELGGFPQALQLAKEAAGVPKDAKVRFKIFPHPKSIVETIKEKVLGIGMEGGIQSTAAAARTIKAIEPLARLARQMGLVPEPGALSMPEMGPVE